MSEFKGGKDKTSKDKALKRQAKQGKTMRGRERLWYPPDLQEEAVKTVLAQAELLCAEWTN